MLSILVDEISNHTLISNTLESKSFIWVVIDGMINTINLGK